LPDQNTLPLRLRGGQSPATRLPNSKPSTSNLFCILRIGIPDYPLRIPRNPFMVSTSRKSVWKFRFPIVDSWTRKGKTETEKRSFFRKKLFLEVIILVIFLKSARIGQSKFLYILIKILSNIKKSYQIIKISKNLNKTH
jgi:hypothetical protein